MSSPFSFSVRTKPAKRKSENNVDAETKKKYRIVYSEKKELLDSLFQQYENAEADNNYQAMINICDRVLEILHNFPTALEYRSIALVRLEKAINNTTLMLVNDPTNTATLHRQGYAKLMSGDVEGALEDFVLALDCHPPLSRKKSIEDKIRVCKKRLESRQAPSVAPVDSSSIMGNVGSINEERCGESLEDGINEESRVEIGINVEEGDAQGTDASLSEDASSSGDWDEDEYSYDNDNDEEMVNDRTSDAMARNERELAKLNATVELNVEGMPHQLGSAMDVTIPSSGAAVAPLDFGGDEELEAAFTAVVNVMMSMNVRDFFDDESIIATLRDCSNNGEVALQRLQSTLEVSHQASAVNEQRLVASRVSQIRHGLASVIESSPDITYTPFEENKHQGNTMNCVANALLIGTQSLCIGRRRLSLQDVYIVNEQHGQAVSAAARLIGRMSDTGAHARYGAPLIEAESVELGDVSSLISPFLESCNIAADYAQGDNILVNGGIHPDLLEPLLESNTAAAMTCFGHAICISHTDTGFVIVDTLAPNPLGERAFIVQCENFDDMATILTGYVQAKLLTGNGRGAWEATILKRQQGDAVSEKEFKAGIMDALDKASHSTRLPSTIRDIETKVMSSLISVTLPVLSAVGLVLEVAITSHLARELKTVHLDIVDLLAVAASEGIDIIPMLKKSGLSVSSGVNGVSCTLIPNPYNRFALIRAHNLVRMRIETFYESFVPFVPSTMPSLPGCVSTMDITPRSNCNAICLGLNAPNPKLELDQLMHSERSERKLLEVISENRIRTLDPVLCDCGLVACCRWGGGSEGSVDTYCLDCQELHEGGWPTDPSLIPVDYMTVEHKGVMCEVCTCFEGTVNFPDLPTESPEFILQESVASQMAANMSSERRVGTNQVPPPPSVFTKESLLRAVFGDKSPMIETIIGICDEVGDGSEHALYQLMDEGMSNALKAINGETDLQSFQQQIRDFDQSAFDGIELIAPELARLVNMGDSVIPGASVGVNANYATLKELKKVMDLIRGKFNQMHMNSCCIRYQVQTLPRAVINSIRELLGLPYIPSDVVLQSVVKGDIVCLCMDNKGNCPKKYYNKVDKFFSRLQFKTRSELFALHGTKWLQQVVGYHVEQRSLGVSDPRPFPVYALGSFASKELYGNVGPQVFPGSLVDYHSSIWHSQFCLSYFFKGQSPEARARFNAIITSLCLKTPEVRQAIAAMPDMKKTADDLLEEGIVGDVLARVGGRGTAEDMKEEYELMLEGRIEGGMEVQRLARLGRALKTANYDLEELTLNQAKEYDRFLEKHQYKGDEDKLVASMKSVVGNQDRFGTESQLASRARRGELSSAEIKATAQVLKLDEAKLLDDIEAFKNNWDCIGLASLVHQGKMTTAEVEEFARKNKLDEAKLLDDIEAFKNTWDYNSDARKLASLVRKGEMTTAEVKAFATEQEMDVDKMLGTICKINKKFESEQEIVFGRPMVDQYKNSRNKQCRVVGCTNRESGEDHHRCCNAHSADYERLGDDRVYAEGYDTDEEEEEEKIVFGPPMVDQYKNTTNKQCRVVGCTNVEQGEDHHRCCKAHGADYMRLGDDRIIEEEEEEEIVFGRPKVDYTNASRKYRKCRVDGCTKQQQGEDYHFCCMAHGADYERLGDDRVYAEGYDTDEEEEEEEIVFGRPKVDYTNASRKYRKCRVDGCTKAQEGEDYHFCCKVHGADYERLGDDRVYAEGYDTDEEEEEEEIVFGRPMVDQYKNTRCKQCRVVGCTKRQKGEDHHRCCSTHSADYERLGDDRVYAEGYESVEEDTDEDEEDTDEEE